MGETPGKVRSLGPALGSGNQAIFGDQLGMAPAEIEALRKAELI